MKFLIVGGGIAGLAIAWRLSRKGLAVELVERGICGRGASWAAAGMLAPGGELAGATHALARFAHQSREVWPQFAQDIERASGVQIGYRETGSLVVAETEDQVHLLRKRANGSACWLTSDELRRREPSLSPKLCGALHFPDDAQVDNRAVCLALHTALVANGVNVRENCEVRSVLAVGGEARSLVTDDGVLEADKIVLACGAWINLITGTGIDLPPVKPVKGQMAACLPPAGMTLPAALIWSDGVYLAPRGHRLLIGATVEDAGFDTSVERRAWEHLSRSATRLIPSFGHWTLAEFWAGLRPHMPDAAPIIGETAISGLYVAGGQFRNGILFAPAVADFMEALLCGEDPGAFASEFSPLRFQALAVTR